MAKREVVHKLVTICKLVNSNKNIKQYINTKYVFALLVLFFRDRIIDHQVDGNTITVLAYSPSRSKLISCILNTFSFPHHFVGDFVIFSNGTKEHVKLMLSHIP